MPSRHLQKIYAVDAYYHVFNRGVGKRIIFKEDEDYSVFLNLLKRYLGLEPVKDKMGREYPWYHKQIELLAFCLMPNHFHLLVFQKDAMAMSKLMRSLCTAYTMYFNKKYKRVGHLFQDRFKASMISNDAYLQHITRYIHLNPQDYKNWQFSSLPYYFGYKQATWLNPQLILGLFEGESYSSFLEDYESHRQMLKEIKSELAGDE